MEDEKKEIIIKNEIINKNKTKLPLVKIIIIIVIAAILFGGGIFGISNIFKSQEKVLKLGLKDVGELVTQTCHTVVLEDTEESKYIFDIEIPFTKSRQIFSYDFDVDASINFSEIDIEEINDTEKEIKVRVPHAKVYKVILVPDSFKSYLDSDGLFTRIDLTEHNEALIRMEEAAKNQCLASNLLDHADENAQRLISAMIKSENKYEKYTIVYNYYTEKLTEE